MSGYWLALLVGAGFFLGINALFWGVFALIERACDKRMHICGDALTWCGHCMDDKQRVWSAFLKGEVKV